MQTLPPSSTVESPDQASFFGGILRCLSRLPALQCAIVVLGGLSASVSEVSAASYEFIGTTDAAWTSTVAANWNQNSPWSGTPTTSGPTSSDNLNLAAPSGAYLSTNNFSRAVLNLSATSGAQMVRGTSGFDVTLSIGNNLTVSGTGTGLTLRDGSSTSLMSVVVTGNASVGAGSSLYLGSSNDRSPLKAFSVQGTTTVSGTLLNNRTNSGTISLGDLNVASTGSVILNYLNNNTVSTTTVGLRSLAGAGRIYAADGAGTQIKTANLVITTATNSNATFSGTLSTLSSVGGTGNLNLTVQGLGRQTLTGSNTYTGSTSISGGTLILSGAGSINSTSAISINGGSFRSTSSVGLNRNVTLQSGTFGYSSAQNYTGTLTYTAGTVSGTNWMGSLGNQTIGAGKTIDPGNSPGTATTTSQTWAAGGAYNWEINDGAGIDGLNSDLLNLTGGLNITATEGGKFTIYVISLTADNAFGELQNFNASVSDNWLIADAASAIAFSADAFELNLTGFVNTYTGSWMLQRGDAAGIGGDSSQIYLSYVAVPEPSTMILLGLGLAAVLVKCRKIRVGRS